MLSSKPHNLHVQSLGLFPEKTIEFEVSSKQVATCERTQACRSERRGLLYGTDLKVIHALNLQPQGEGHDLGRYPGQLYRGFDKRSFMGRTVNGKCLDAELGNDVALMDLKDQGAG